MKKEFIEVIVKYTIDGTKFPQLIIWKDGRKFEVDKILDIRQAPSLKVGGQGIRYTCKIMGKETFLWLEDEKWFVEGK
jgi:hypothetical protein